MKISVFGLGWVGAVTAVCLADNGHEVWGVDNDPKKVNWISRGIPPVREPGLGEKLLGVLESESLKVTLNAYEAVAATDIAMVCVGTPTQADGRTDLSFVSSVIDGIGGALREIGKPFTVVVRSTVPLGTTRDVVLPRLEHASGMKVGDGLQLFTNPEFLREGTALKDFYSPPFNIVGKLDDDGIAAMEELYSNIDAPFMAINYQEAELLKLACNGFHALKVAFANEIGALAGRVDADPMRVMEAFVLDTKLNVSKAYLKPGFAFGGSCLPKDVRAINHTAISAGVDLPLCGAILESNESHLDRIAQPLISGRFKKIGMVGLVFKAGTDDIRESPAVKLVRRLIDAGKEVTVYEPELNVERLSGANLEYLTSTLPEYRDLLVSWEAVSSSSDALVLTRRGVVTEDELEIVELPKFYTDSLGMKEHLDSSILSAI